MELDERGTENLCYVLPAATTAKSEILGEAAVGAVVPLRPPNLGREFVSSRVLGGVDGKYRAASAAGVALAHEIVSYGLGGWLHCLAAPNDQPSCTEKLVFFIYI